MPVDQSNAEHEEHDVSEESRDKCVLTILTDDGGWPWTVDEIGRELHSSLDAADAVARLVAAGLVHRLGEFVFPSRAGRRAEQIAAGTI